MVNTERDPFLVVLSGPGGVGKGTLAKELVERDEELILSQSWTTRPRRNDENPEVLSCIFGVLALCAHHARRMKARPRTYETCM